MKIKSIQNVSLERYVHALSNREWVASTIHLSIYESFDFIRKYFGQALTKLNDHEIQDYEGYIVHLITGKANSLYFIVEIEE